LSERIKTRIEGLDKVLEGGLPDRSLILVTGEAGSHYETFVNQLLFEHVTSGGKVAYYLFESPISDIIDDLQVHGWKLDKYLEDGSWHFVSIQTPEIEQLTGTAQEVEKSNLILSYSTSAFKNDFLSKAKEGRWTAIQFSYLIIYYESRDIMDLIFYLKSAIRVHGGIHFILIPGGMHEEKMLNLLKHLADGVFEFMVRERGREFEGTFTIRKLRKILHRTKRVPFVVAEKGIRIETAERIV